MSAPNIVKRDEPLQIDITIKQGEHRVSVTTILNLKGWPSLTADERKEITEETARAALAGLLGELTFE